MPENFHDYSREARSPDRMEATSALFGPQDTVGAVADHVEYEKHPAEKERPMRAEITVTVRQATMRDTIEGIFGLIEDALTAVIAS